MDKNQQGNQIVLKDKQILSYIINGKNSEHPYFPNKSKKMPQ